MDLLTLARLFRRNLVVGLLAIAVGGALLAAVVVTAPPLYRSSGSVVLFSPPLAPDLQPGETPPDGVENPYVRFNDLSVVVDIVRRVLVGRDVDAELRDLGVVGTYTVAANLDYYRGPIVDVVVEAPTADAARTSTELVMTRLEDVLDDLQAREGTQPTYRIKSEVVVHPQDGTRVLSSTLRRGMAGSVLAAGLVVLAVLASEAWRNRRARTTDRTSDEDESVDDMSGDEDAVDEDSAFVFDETDDDFDRLVLTQLREHDPATG